MKRDGKFWSKSKYIHGKLHSLNEPSTIQYNYKNIYTETWCMNNKYIKNEPYEITYKNGKKFIEV